MTRTLSFRDANAQFDLDSVLSAYNEEEDVLVLDSGIYAAADLDLDEHSYVVDGDVSFEGNVSASEEGGFLVVRGNLTVGSLLIGGPMVHVSGSLVAAHAIHTDYNHGELVVRGDVRAQIIAAEHLFRIDGTLHCPTTIDFGGLRVADPTFTPTLTRQQAARESSTYFVAEVLNDQGYVDGGQLAELLAEGRNPLRG